MSDLPTSILCISDSFSALPESEFGHKIQQLVMPIVAKAHEKVIPVGTGFMINRDGLMMTAAHVLAHAEKHKVRVQDDSGKYFDYYELYAFYITNRKHGDRDQYLHGGLWPIDKLWCTEGSDIGLCWLRSATFDGKRVHFPTVSLSPGIPKIGEKILGFGYYNSVGFITDEIVDGRLKASYFHDTAFARGEILEIYPQSRDKAMLSFPCFHTDARFEPGMSGGPIFNETGAVCGVICSSLPPDEEYPKYISYGSLLWPAMGARIEGRLDTEAKIRAITIYDLVKVGNILADETMSRIGIVEDADGRLIVSVQT